MAGLIIGVVGKKGGSGKTTVAVNLAGALAELFNEVLVIDSDPQGTALTWRAAAGDTGFPVQVIGLPQAVIHQEGIVKLTAGQKNTFHSVAIWSGSEALTSHLAL
jgi:cellulose biosynthesis protein BcsQ